MVDTRPLHKGSMDDNIDKWDCVDLGMIMFYDIVYLYLLY